ncbi:winged helix-turn-helix domain-containing protein [Microbacterium sp. ASV81]|uniref:Crosslink repair DNA glycosylase YcaQ family protein n=1 Tax=Microbacterium capsulatum TaxID=3041921 RepID=A0ABU0XFN5_9MICO|nr:crosslink repair DNA glycosylase YcaQ family protein [Microbacterium sp. ASV81]MDQ4213932.1 crosslink repair DNA glycosylase YcaQ family protein [Microbacterium sp. ASV81]
MIETSGGGETLSAAEARRMALAAQGFSRRRPALPSARHLHAAMARMGVLQIDSVNVFARSHYLPLFSRLGGYDPALLDRAFLSRPTPSRAGRYTEYIAHEATFLPVEDWPLWGFRRQAFRDKRGAFWGQSSSARSLDWIRAELRDRGPSRPAEIRGDAPRGRGGWWEWDEAKHALEYLWRIGEVAIAGRDGFERRYALAEDVVPAELLGRDRPPAEAIGELVRRAARAHGVATAADIADYYRIKDRTAVLAAIGDLVDAGELTPVRVRGWERGGRPIPAWRHADAALPRRIDAAAILTPFDPVVWFRDRALRAFQLDYRIEIYTPAAKRRYGYYSLPVLVGDRISARLDLKADRAARTLLVQSAWWEPQARPAADTERIAAELRAAAAWQGLEKVSVSGWGDAADELADAMAGHPERVGRHDVGRTDRVPPGV